jgi:hypothetical protein
VCGPLAEYDRSARRRRAVAVIRRGHDGNFAGLAMPLEPMVAPIVFDRAAAGECLDPTFRQACVGTFRNGAMIHAVAQDRDGQLTLSPSSQPTYTLRPFRDRTFTIAALSGFRIEFRRTHDGAVDQMIFHQPNGTFVAQRVGPAASLNVEQ